MHPRHTSGPLDTENVSFAPHAECLNSTCLRHFCYINDTHLFCTTECFEEYVQSNKLDVKDSSQLHQHFRKVTLDGK